MNRALKKSRLLMWKILLILNQKLRLTSLAASSRLSQGSIFMLLEPMMAFASSTWVPVTIKKKLFLENQKQNGKIEMLNKKFCYLQYKWQYNS